MTPLLSIFSVVAQAFMFFSANPTANMVLVGLALLFSFLHRVSDVDSPAHCLVV